MSAPVSESFDPPQPWNTPMIGKSPSGPIAGAGGKPTFTSIGAPSKVVKMPAQWRSPLFAPDWTVQGTEPPKTSEMVAPAPDAVARIEVESTSADVRCTQGLLSAEPAP